MTDLIERLRAVEWEEIDDGDRTPDDPAHECVFVDMRPADFRALLREAADALEAAREDAERYRWLRENCVVWAEDTDEPQLVHRDGGLGRTDWRERLDAAIDQAMKEQA